MMVITNPAMVVWLIRVQTAQNNVQEEYLKHVPVVYGLVAQSVLQIRYVVAAIAQHVHPVSMYMRIFAKMIVQQIVVHMTIHAPKIMRRLHARMVHVLIHAIPISVM
jgi:hypothetical protein